MRNHLIVLLIACFAIPLLGAQPATAQATPRFEPYECQFDTDFLPEVTCGYLYVPEDRANPQGTQLRLHVAIFHSYASRPEPDPVVYLEGGPGGNVLEMLPYSFWYFAPILEKRDLIFFDQRGTGYSGPLRLNCDEYGNMLYDTLDEQLTPDEMAALTIEAMTLCRDRLQGRGVNLAAYTSAENAADLADLRTVLNYDSWNLFGISYGTRLALTTMRDYPAGIRSVIIDSVVPLQVSLYDEEPANAEHALNVLFYRCALDPECNKQYPRLGTVFYELVAQLNAAPAEAIITHPVSNREYHVLVDGDRLVGLVFSALYSADFIPLLPKIIYDVRAGDYTLLASTLESILHDRESFSIGMHFSVQCSEEAPFTSRDSVAEAAAAFPLLRGYFDEGPNSGQPLFALCEIWNTNPPNPVENAPVSSFIPTLVLSGEFDPITPARWGRQAAATLTNSYVYEIPGVGHGASVSAKCPMEILLEFLDNPYTAPDSSCIDSMPPVDFYVIDTNITLVPFTDEFNGIGGVYPESWIELVPGMYQRSEVDDEALIYTVLPGIDPQTALTYVAQEFGIYVPPQAIDSRRSSNFFWRIYEFRVGEAVYNLALAEGNGRTYAVLLLSKRFEQPHLYQSVLLPAIDALHLL